MLATPAHKTSEDQATAVSLNRVSKLYGSFVALRDVSLTLAAGSSVVLLGPNGAGKSTLLKLLAGLARPSYGEVLTFGEQPSVARSRIAYMGHNTMLYDELTGQENLQYFLGLHRPDLSTATCKEQAVRALSEVDLDPTSSRRLGEYSQGMRQRASLARVLLSEPDLLLLDEPFSNLDTSSVAAMLVRLQRYLSHGATKPVANTLLLTTHQAELARPLAQQTLVLQEGRIVPTYPPPSSAHAGPAASAAFPIS